MYSLTNKDILSDSGTASIGLKIDVLTLALSACLFLFHMVNETAWPLAVIPLFYALNLYVNRGVFVAYFRAKGVSFSVLAMSYYTLVFPVAVGAGALIGVFQYLWSFKVLGKYR